jgi:hypothetical protein
MNPLVFLASALAWPPQLPRRERAGTYGAHGGPRLARDRINVRRARRKRERQARKAGARARRGR